MGVRIELAYSSIAFASMRKNSIALVKYTFVSQCNILLCGDIRWNTEEYFAIIRN